MEKINFTKGSPVINGVWFRKADGAPEVNAANEEEPLLPNGLELNSQDAPGAALIENEGEHLIPGGLITGGTKPCIGCDDDDVNLRRNII